MQAIAQKQTEFVKLNGKEYTVTLTPGLRKEDGSQLPPDVSIWVEWQVPSIADRWSARPQMIWKSTSVSPYGRLGRKIMQVVHNRLIEKSTGSTR